METFREEYDDDDVIFLPTASVHVVVARDIDVNHDIIPTARHSEYGTVPTANTDGLSADSNQHHIAVNNDALVNASIDSANEVGNLVLIENADADLTLGDSFTVNNMDPPPLSSTVIRHRIYLDEEQSNFETNSNDDVLCCEPTKRDRNSLDDFKEDRKRPLVEDDTETEGSVCPVCYEPWANSGKHRIVSLACGHLFGKRS